MTAKDFLDTNDFTKDQLLDMIELSRVLKRCVKAGYFPELLRHKALGMIFQQVSTRTRLSFEGAMADLGGDAQFYAPGTIQLGGHETIEDSARVMGASWTSSWRASTVTRTSSSWRSTRRCP